MEKQADEKKVVKDKRVNMLFPKQTYDDFQALAHLHQTTPNEIINKYIAKYVAENQAALREYRELQEKYNISVKDSTGKAQEAEGE